jgi:hypothetical protein
MMGDLHSMDVNKQFGECDHVVSSYAWLNYVIISINNSD